MKNALFQKHMDRYIPMMEKTYEYRAKKVTDDCILFYDEMDGSRVEVLLFDREKTSYMNHHYTKHETCVIKEDDQELILITEIEEELFFISCTKTPEEFQYTYRKWNHKHITGVEMEERVLLDFIFNVFRDMLEQDPAYRLLFVTGQLGFYQYN